MEERHQEWFARYKRQQLTKESPTNDFFSQLMTNKHKYNQY